MSPRQRRGLIMLVLAVVGLVGTFLSVLQYTRDVSAQLGPRQDVVVIRREVDAFLPIDEASLDVVSVPVVFAPPGALTAVGDVRGRVSPLPLPAGTFVQAASLIPPPALVYGERAVTLSADPEMSVGQALRPNDIVLVVAAVKQGPKTTSTVVVKGARVIAVRRPDPNKENVLVTLALSEKQTLDVARARGAGAKLIVGQFPSIEPAS